MKEIKYKWLEQFAPNISDEVALEFIENELVNDIYLFDQSFKWTYVNTHESMCGPYFFTFTS